MIEAPYPVTVTGGPQPAMTLDLPPRAAGKVEAQLLDLGYLVENALLVGGSVPVIVAGTPALVAPRLEAARTFDGPGLVAGTVPLAQLASLATAPGVHRVFLDDVARPLLADSVPLVGADATHREVDGSGRAVTGHGVTIAVIDAGVDHTHPDLGGCFGTGCRVAAGYDYVDDDTDPMDENGHGTHVAATAAGEHGVAPNATIHAYRVCGTLSCAQSDIIAALENATQQGDDVISMSLGGPGTTQGPLATTVDWAVDQGAVVVSAAGNSGPGSQTIGEPGAALKGITVGASDDNDALAPFSSRGPVLDANGTVVAIKPDLVAPGVDIRAAVPTGSCSLCDPSGYNRLSGTSMATPHVSGAAALLLQAHPDWRPDGVKAALTGQAVPLGSNARSEGRGRLDAHAAWSAQTGLLPSTGYLGVALPDQDSFEATFRVSAINLDDIEHTVNLSHDAAFGTVTFETDQVTLAPQEIRTVNASVHADTAGLAEGWYEANLTAVDEVMTGGAGISFVHSGLLRIGAGPTTDHIQLFKDGVSFKRWHNPAEQVEILAPTGRYDAVASLDGCPPEVDTCHPWAETFTFEEDRQVDGIAWMNFSLDDGDHETRLVARLDDGTPLDPAATDWCPYAADVAPCWERQLILLAGEGFPWWIYSVTSGVNAPVYVEEASPAWHLGRTNVFRHGGTTYAVSNHTASVTDDVVFDTAPARYDDWPVVYDTIAPYEEGRRLHVCHQSRLGFTTSRPVTDMTRERIVAARHDAEHIPLGSWLPPVDPEPCGQIYQFLVMGEHDAEARCIEPGGCPWLAKSLFQAPGEDGVIQGDYTSPALVVDDRSGFVEGAIPLQRGAAAFNGELAGSGHRLRLLDGFAPNDWDHFRPASGGTQFLHVSNTTWDVWVDDTTVRAGQAPERDQSLNLPHDGNATARLVHNASYVGDHRCRATHVATYQTTRLVNTLPSIAWARVVEEGDLGSSFPDASGVQLRFKVDPGTVKHLAGIHAVVTNGDQIRVYHDLPVREDVHTLTLPDLGPGAYLLRLHASRMDGATTVLTQDPGYVVDAACDLDRPGAIATATPGGGQGPLTTRFDARTSVSPGQELLEVRWRHDGQVISTEPTIVRTFEQSGAHCLELEVEDAQGRTDRDVACAYVRVPPVAVPETNVSVAHLDQPARFDASGSHDPDGRIVETIWTVDGQVVSQEASFDVTRQEPGEVCAELEVVDAHGLADTDQACVTFSTPPRAVAQVFPQRTNLGFDVLFDGSTSHDTDGRVVDQRWLEPKTGKIVGQGPSLLTRFHEVQQACLVHEVTDDTGLNGTDQACVEITDHISIDASPEGAPYGPQDQATIVAHASYVTGEPTQGREAQLEVRYRPMGALAGVLVGHPCTVWEATAPTDATGHVRFKVPPAIFDRCADLPLPPLLEFPTPGASRYDATVTIADAAGNHGNATATYEVEIFPTSAG